MKILKRSSGLRPRWFALLLITAMVVPVAAVLFINLSRDPFQIFFADLPVEAVFLGGHGKSRYQQAGVVRHYQPESVVIGHSLAANFLPSRMEELLGWSKVYSLALPGATIYEQSMVARYALKHSGIDRVLWLFSPVNLRLGAFVTQPKVKFPIYLYDDFRPNDLTFFATLPWNLSPYSEQKQALRNRLQLARSDTEAKVDSRDYATAWHYLRNHKFNVPQKVVGSIIGAGKNARTSYDNEVQQAGQQLTPADISSISIDPDNNFFDNLGKNVFTVIEANPGTQFSVVLLPPLSRLYWQRLRVQEPDKYKLHLAYVREATTILSKLENVSLYAFGREDFSEDLRLYRDDVHFHLVGNNYMLAEIAGGRGKLSTETVNQYLSAFDGDVRSYRLPARWQAPGKLNGETLKRGELTMDQAVHIMESYTAN